MRQSISRINIHRSKKLNAIAKKKDDICKHLEAGNEMNAKIWVSLNLLRDLMEVLICSYMRNVIVIILMYFRLKH